MAKRGASAFTSFIPELSAPVFIRRSVRICTIVAILQEARLKPWKPFLLALLLVLVIVIVAGALFIHRGFRATNQPSGLESFVARAARNYSIPSAARSGKNPLDATAQNLQDGREAFLANCQTCHGHDGSGLTPVGQSLYPRVPDLRAGPTQNLTDGEIHYIIENGVELTGMPAWAIPIRCRMLTAGS